MPFDVDTYLARLGRTGGRAGTPVAPDSLAELMRAHIEKFTFENLDQVAGRVPSLDLDDLAGKMVTGDRGGYCYEHNTLFRAVLQELGFHVTLHAGRVMAGMRDGAVRPRTHMLLFVHFDGEPTPYLADVGFGTVGCLLAPIRLAEAELDDAPRRHRLVRTPGEGPTAQAQWVLQARDGTGWANQYMFTEEQFQPPDYQMYNWYLATYPSSPFKLAPFVQRTFADRHLALHGRTLTETQAADGKEAVRELAGRDELIAVLRTEFGLAVPDYFAWPEPDCG